VRLISIKGSFRNSSSSDVGVVVVAFIADVIDTFVVTAVVVLIDSICFVCISICVVCCGEGRKVGRGCRCSNGSVFKFSEVRLVAPIAFMQPTSSPR